eukprot:scaffold2308_cov92-Isochrysis_galbana.AAC.2
MRDIVATAGAAAADRTPSATSISHRPLAPVQPSSSETSSTPADSRASKSGSRPARCVATVRHAGDGSGDVAPNGDGRLPSTMKRTEAAVASGAARSCGGGERKGGWRWAGRARAGGCGGRRTAVATAICMRSKPPAMTDISFCFEVLLLSLARAEGWRPSLRRRPAAADGPG